MPGTTQKKTQKARPKKQVTRKVKATTVNVTVKNQAVAINSKTKAGVKRAPRRKTAAAPAAPAQPPVLYASVFNTSPVTARPPVYDFPVQYEPVKSPAVEVQNMPTPTISVRPETVSAATQTDSINPENSDISVQITPHMDTGSHTISSSARARLIDLARQHGVPIKVKMSTAALSKKLEKVWPKIINMTCNVIN